MDHSTWAKAVWDKITVKMDAQTRRMGAKIPYLTADGHYADKMDDNIYWWCNGFWPGMLWLLHHGTGAALYATAARAAEERLDAALAGYVGLHHDVGFQWNLSAVFNYRLTGDASARTRALHAASLLAGRYNPRGKFIRSWNQDKTGWIIIDCMMNLPLLYWASEESGDPRFGFIAIEHTETAMKTLIRPDGSCNHIVSLCPETGAFLEAFGGQGYDKDSAWTRGQSWALYGFLLGYRHTGDVRYLDCSKRIAHYFIACVAQTGYVTRVDFRAPAEPIKLDTSAAMIAACGLLHLADVVPEHERPLYTNAAIAMLQAVEADHCNWEPGYDSIVQNCTAQYHDRLEELHVSHIYADYFFVEAVHKLLHPDFKCW